MWIYRKSEPGLWTVGYKDTNTGEWHSGNKAHDCDACNTESDFQHDCDQERRHFGGRGPF